MAKFNRKTDKLRARVMFIRGALQKAKGSELTEEEVDTLSDETIQDQVNLEILEIVEGEKEADPPAGGEGDAGKKGRG
jgi:hypothetical protein